MRGISEERLKQIAHETHDSDDTNLPVLSLLDLLISECQELNPWIPLEEFFKSGFEGWCWIAFDHGAVHMSLYQCNEFYFNADTDYTYCKETILKVQPIHKPEPPR